MVEQLAEHPDWYKEWVAGPYDMYLKKMAMHGVWGDHITLQDNPNLNPNLNPNPNWGDHFTLQDNDLNPNYIIR